MSVPDSGRVQPQSRLSQGSPGYRQFMVRELLIWLVGVPVPITAIIGYFVL